MTPSCMNGAVPNTASASLLSLPMLRIRSRIEILTRNPVRVVDILQAPDLA